MEKLKDYDSYIMVTTFSDPGEGTLAYMDIYTFDYLSKRPLGAVLVIHYYYY
jgi:hypothetical protein